MKKVITIFGSAIPLKGESSYEEAYKLGILLAKNNFDICTGGNLGTMEAVSKGAIQNGSKTTGITLNGKFDNHNSYLSNHIKCSTLFERIEYLINKADGFIILQGGTGTLLELATIWEYLNKGFIKEKPIAAVGNFWESIITIIDNQLKLEGRKPGRIKCFLEVAEAVDFITQELNA